MMPAYRCAIVIGASSGLGAELVRQLAASGCRVAAIARRQDRLEELARNSPELILPVVHDVHDLASIPELFQQVTGKLGGLDLFIYAAGVMPDLGFSEYSLEKDREIIEVNLLGAIAWLDSAAQRLGQVGHGSLVAIGSRAGERGLGSKPAYSASKAGVASFMEGLRNRVAAKGVKVSTFKPGPIDTEMISHLHIRQPMPVQTAARIILAKSHRTGEHYLKVTDRFVCWVMRRIPSSLFRKLKA